jgi:hypothetical protein
MVAESAPALVVVGESDGAAAALLSTLVHGARGGSEGANEASSDDLEGPGPHALRLDTKYYTVDVAATVHTLPDESRYRRWEHPRGVPGGCRRGVRSHQGWIVREDHQVVPSEGPVLVSGD